MGLTFVCLAVHVLEPRRWTGGFDPRICQTFAAYSAEPGKLPYWFSVGHGVSLLCWRSLAIRAKPAYLRMAIRPRTADLALGDTAFERALVLPGLPGTPPNKDACSRPLSRRLSTAWLPYNQLFSRRSGDEIPISTWVATVLSNANTPVVNTIEMRNTGVILKVLPHVHANGTIQLEIEQEISNVVNPNQQTLTPTISQRRVHSTVAVTSGQTVLLGGLISEQDQKT